VLYSASSPKGKGCLGPQHPAQPNGQRSARSRLSSLGRVGHDMPSQPAKPAHGPARKPEAGPAASRRRMGSNGHPPISARQNRRPVHPPQTLAHFSPSLSSPEPGPAAALAGASRQAGPLAMVARKGPAPTFLGAARRRPPMATGHLGRRRQRGTPLLDPVQPPPRRSFFSFSFLSTERQRPLAGRRWWRRRCTPPRRLLGLAGARTPSFLPLPRAGTVQRRAMVARSDGAAVAALR